jgi:hypothetical protein
VRPDRRRPRIPAYSPEADAEVHSAVMSGRSRERCQEPHAESESAVSAAFGSRRSYAVETSWRACGAALASL